MKVRPRPRARPVPGSMNKTEQAYAARLDLLKQAGEIIDWQFEPLKLKLAPSTFYTPDFLVITEECMELHEVKGFWEDDARVKIKVAAQLFPWFRIVAVKKAKGAWEYEAFL